MYLKVGFDVDGCLADFCSGYYLLSREMFGLPEPDATQTSWEFDSVGLNREQQAQIWKRIENTKNWWLTLRRMPGCNLLKGFMEDNAYEVYFITARLATAGMPVQRQTAKWLENKFNIMPPSVICSDDKSKFALALELDYYIDDKLQNIEGIVGKTKAYLKDASYNQKREGKMLRRVKDVDSFIEVIYERR